MHRHVGLKVKKGAPTAVGERGEGVSWLGVAQNVTSINDKCGDAHPAALQGRVREGRADIGIVVDGDADRRIVVDEKGQVVDGDQLMALLARDWARSGKLQGGGIVATVMSNLGLERFVESEGLTLHRDRKSVV